jgi:hypothetical protein
MIRRSLSLLAAAALALSLAAVPATAAAPFPTRLDLPSGWMPEGITAGPGTTVYVGSLAGMGIWAADVRTGEGHVLVQPWGGAAAGVEYDAAANRIWVAGASDGTATGTVHVFDATTGDPLETYTFTPSGFLNDLVVTDSAVYVTDSNNAWLDVIPLGDDGALPDPGDVMTLPLTGITFEPNQFNANGIVATRGWLIVVDSFTGGLFRVDPATGDATEISTGGVSVANGDGLELLGSTLYVVRNADQIVEAFRLGGGLASATWLGNLGPLDDVSVTTTAAVQAGSVWVVNARFGVTTTEYWVTRFTLRPLRS